MTKRRDGSEMRMWARRVGPMLIGVLLAGVSGCVDHRAVSFHLDADVERPAKSVVLFFPDGLDLTVLERAVQAGELPNIQRVFYQGGTRVEAAVDSMPSVTYANCSSIVTGQFPGHHGILGNRWFDRHELLSRWYMTFGSYRTVNDHLDVPTLYDVLGDHFTLNIQLHTRKGVTCTFDNYPMFFWSWILGSYEAADTNVERTFEDFQHTANRIKRWPSVIMTYYPGVDEVGHNNGPDSPQYKSTMLDLDRTVGRVTTAIEQADLADRTIFILFADHGMAPTHQYFDFRRWARQCKGLNFLEDVVDAPDYLERYNQMERYDSFLTVGSDRHAIIHLRGQQGWSHQPRVEEVEAVVSEAPAIHELPAVACVVRRDGENRVKVRTKEGALIVQRKAAGRKKRYRVIEQQADALGYRAEPTLAAFIDAGWHDSREWLAATAQTQYPDFVPQVVEMFDSRRAGDIVVFANEDWSLATLYKGGHGSCVARDMRIPMMFAGPGIPHGATIPHARLVDLAPTVIGFVNESQRLAEYPSMDGIDLSPQLLGSNQTTAQ